MIEQLVVNIICNRLNISFLDLLSGRRKEELVNARQAICFALSYFGFSQNDIAKILGYSDHSPVSHLLKVRSHKKDESIQLAIDCVLDCAPRLASEIKRLNKKLKSK
mgnify:CR=1 FL=1|tara:strand:- start:245 stop:565 length:321 start_codon:yes stop_codon:yes gene_type:complete